MSIDLDSFRSRVDRRLTHLLEEQAALWERTGLTVPAFAAISGLTTLGGKRVRPVFVYLGWCAAGADPGSDEPVRLGAAVELMHVSALLHDDVVDASSTRRGGPTAHVHAAGVHRGAGWSGDPSVYGTGLAILAGDLAAAIADETFGPAPTAVADHWRRMKTEVAVGQVLDHVGTARRERDPSAAREVVRLKTSQYTVVRPLLIGASAAVDNVESELGIALERFGTAVGEAFQLRDDILGTFGDAETTGKPVGTDLREGKPTLLLALAHERADVDGKSLLARAGSTDLTAREMDEIAEVIRSTGALEEIEDRITRLTSEALDHLGAAPMPDSVRTALGDFVLSLVTRTS